MQLTNGPGEPETHLPGSNAMRQLAKVAQSMTMDQAMSHKILALAYSRRLTPPEWAETARARLAKNIRRQAVVQGVLEDLAREVRNLNIGLLKGAALWGDLYRPGEREASDVDLFIDPRNRDRLLAGLAKLGFDRIYVERDSRSAHKTLCLNRGHDDLAFEIHTQLFWREPIGFAWRWRNALRPGFLRLTPEDQLVHLCSHWINQHTMISLHWYFDIALFCETHHVDWAKVEARAATLGCVRSVRLARRLTEGAHVAGDGLARIDFDFLLEPRKNLLRYFFLKHAVQDSWADALKYDLQWLSGRLSGRD